MKVKKRLQELPPDASDNLREELSNTITSVWKIAAVFESQKLYIYLVDIYTYMNGSRNSPFAWLNR